MEKKSKTLFKLGKSKNINKESKKDLNENDLSQNNVPIESEKHGKKILKDINKQQEKQKKIEQQQLKLQQQQINSIIKSKQKQIKMQQKKSNEDNKFYTFKSKNKNDKDLNDQLATTSQITKCVQDKTKFIQFNQEPDKMEVFSYRVKGKLVGIEPVMAAKGDKMCQNALKNLKLIRRSTSSHKQRIIININLDGVQLLDQKTNELVANHVINLISYITRDATDSHTFGYVYGTPEVGHQFIAIKSEKDSKYIMKAIGELFTYVYNKKKREKFLELETRNYNCNLNENTQTFVDNRIEDKKDNQNLDYESLMNFLKQQQEKNFQQPTSSSQVLPLNNFDSLNKSFNSSIECKIENKLQQSNFDSLPPLPPPRNESGQSNYSSNSNLNSFGTYDTMNSNSNLDSLQCKTNCNLFQSTNSLATDASHSEMQTLQNVISSARKANEKYRDWQIFEDNSNNLRSDSVNSNQDSDSIADDCGWASFSPPSHPPPPLYTSNEDLSLTLTSADTFTLVNANVAEDNNNKFITKELNSSQNSSDILQINTPPLSTRRRRRSLKSFENNIIKIDDSIKNKLIKDNLEKTKRKQSQCSTLGFENDFNNTKQFKKNEDKPSFFDQNYTKIDEFNSLKEKVFKSDSKTSTLTKNSIACFESFNFDSFESKNDFSSNQNSLNKGFGIINNIEAFNLNSNLNNLNSLENIYDDSKPNCSSFDSAISINQSSKKDKNYDAFDNEKKSQFSLDNSFNKKNYDPNDKYAVFNNMNNLKTSIFSEKNDEVFFNEVQERNNQSFEDSFLNDSSSKKLSFNSNKSEINEKNNLSLENKDYENFNVDEDLINVHKKFLQERQEKLDEIDKIFEEEKEKLRFSQKEMAQNHLKEQKDLLHKQKQTQQEFYQRQKYQRQSILHQLQLQRLSVSQFDQCKLQLQQKLKNDQKQLQNEFIKNQQLLKKNQKEQQLTLVNQYKLLEQQYLEKQSELLNSNFEIEVDLPELPNIFENDNFEDQNDKFETSLRNEFDKLTNDLIQTTTSSLNSSPKLIERCSTSCSITSSTSNNPFVFEDLKKNEFDLFKDFEKTLKIDCEKNQNENKSNLDSLIFENSVFKNFDFNKSSNSAFSDYSFDYFKNDFNKNTSQERISSACSNKTNESTATLPKNINLLNFVSKQENSLFDKQNENATSNDLQSKSFLKDSNSLLSNSLPKNLEEKSHSNNTILLKNQISKQNSLFTNKINDPFNCSHIDSKLNEISRINELRQHTQQQLVSITLPKKEETDLLNLSTNSDKKIIDNIHKNEFTNDFEKLNVKLENEDKKYSTANLSFFDNLFDSKNSNTLNININEKKNSKSYQDLSSNLGYSKNIDTKVFNFEDLSDKNFFSNDSNKFENKNDLKDLTFNHFGKEHKSPPERNIFNKTEDPFKDDFFE